MQTNEISIETGIFVFTAPFNIWRRKWTNYVHCSQILDRTWCQFLLWTWFMFNRYEFSQFSVWYFVLQRSTLRLCAVNVEFTRLVDVDHVWKWKCFAIGKKGLEIFGKRLASAAATSMTQKMCVCVCARALKIFECDSRFGSTKHITCVHVLKFSKWIEIYFPIVTEY